MRSFRFGRLIISIIKESHQKYRGHFWLKEEKNHKLSWAPAPSRLPPNCHMCSLSLLRNNNRFVCEHSRTWSFFQCFAQWGGSSRSCRTTIPRWVFLHNDRCSIYPGLGPWSEVRRRVRLFLFIFWLSPRAELLPIVPMHWVSKVGEVGVVISHTKPVPIIFRAHLCYCDWVKS